MIHRKKNGRYKVGTTSDTSFLALEKLHNESLVKYRDSL